MSERLHRDSDYLRAVLDAIPSSIFVMDDEVRVVDFNSAASRIYGPKPETMLKRLGGEVLLCVHALAGENTCGTTAFCKDCVVRNSVIKAQEGQMVVREKHEMLLLEDGRQRKVNMFVTAAPFEHGASRLALLILEDVTELNELRSILPICASCKRIRNDEQYWEHVESYLGRHADLRFTHGICPDCLDKLYPNHKESV